MMKLFITGGTGLIGSCLIKKLLNQGHDVTILTRNVQKAQAIVGYQVSCCASLSQLKDLNGYDAVINLAGEPIAGKKWTNAQKERLSNSRWAITQDLSRLIVASELPPSVFLSGSAVGYYGAQSGQILNEDSEAHDEFTHQLCKQWEAYALAAESPRTRVCLLRTGIVLSDKAGALAKMLVPFRLGLGCVLGKGNQYISWIHIDDMVNAIYHLLTLSNAHGVFNMTAPNPVTNRQFSKTLAKTLQRPCWFQIPSFLVSLLMGQAATLLLDGQRVVPQRLQQIYFSFDYPDIAQALDKLLTSPADC